MSELVPIKSLNGILLHSSAHKAFLSLVKLAWKLRIRLPYLLIIGIMLFDVRLTVEVTVNITDDDSGSDTDSDISEEEETDVENDPIVIIVEEMTDVDYDPQMAPT